MIRHVVLVGLMGTGKSTVGRRIAARLDRDFIDADEALVERAGRSIAEIFAESGEEAFRALEVEMLDALLAGERSTVIASGGGVVLRSENRTRLAEPGITTVWLTAGPAFLASRVSPKPHRPLLVSDEPTVDVLTRLHEERSPLYAEVADLTVDVEPFHRDDDGPRTALADRIVDLVTAHEAGIIEGTPS